jgi:hypothetical protein
MAMPKSGRAVFAKWKNPGGGNTGFSDKATDAGARTEQTDSRSVRTEIAGITYLKIDSYYKVKFLRTIMNMTHHGRKPFSARRRIFHV